MKHRGKNLALVLAGILIGCILSGPVVHAAAEAISACRSSHAVCVDGNKIELEAYVIEGNNYVKLRDVGEAVGFNVWWDEEHRTVQNYRADSIAIGELIEITYIAQETGYNLALSESTVPLIDGMDGWFYLFITAHGLCTSESENDYELKLYNGSADSGELLASYIGVDGSLANRPFGNILASGYIRFTALELPSIDNELTIDLTWRGFHLRTTAEVMTAEEIPQVQEFMSYYQNTYGLDKFGREAYSEADRGTEKFALYTEYSTYRYNLRKVYSEQLKTIAMAGNGNYYTALVAAKEKLDAAAEGADCNAGVWVFQTRSDKGTVSRPILIAMPRENTRNSNLTASDAIEAALEAEWPGNWTYTCTMSQFGAFVTDITAEKASDIGCIAYSTGYSSYGFWYINGKFSDWGVSNYDVQDGDFMAWGDPDVDFYWTWAILRWKLGDAELTRVLADNGIAYESNEFLALGADGLAALFSKGNYDRYDEVTWCKYGQFSRYGQLRTLGKGEETIRLINAIGDVSPQSGDAIADAWTSYNNLKDDVGETEAKRLVTNYDVLVAAQAAFDALTQTTSADTVRAAIMATLASDPTAINVGSINGEWKIFALARDMDSEGTPTISAGSEIARNYLLLLNKALTRGDTVKTQTDYERVTFALSSLGYDASAFQYDDSSPIYDLTEAYATFDEDMLLNEMAYALLALNAKPYTEETDAFVSALVEAALDDGGWNLMGMGSPDADMTAIVIQALAPYYETNSEVKDAIDRGLTALQGIQDQNSGGFYSMGQYNSCSIAQVVVALCSLGIYPTGEDWSVGDNGQYNPITALCQFYDSTEKMMKYTLNASGTDEMSTEQAAYALAAYYRLTQQADVLYDMSRFFTTSEANEKALNDLVAVLQSADTDWTLIQADAGDKDDAKTAVETLLKDNNLIPTGVSAEVEIASFEGAAEGTESSPDGTNGKYSATIKLDKGVNATHASATATITDAAITATKWYPSENEKALAELETELRKLNWTLAQEVAGDAGAVKTAVEAMLTEELLNGATAEVTVSAFEAAVAGTEQNKDGVPGSYKASIALSKGSRSTDAPASRTVTVEGTITPTQYVAPSDLVEVTFRLIGAFPADQAVDLSASTYMPEYVTWIPTTTYTVNKTTTMQEFIIQALAAAKLDQVGAESGYISTIYAPEVLTGYALSQKDNGKNSGWMYTVNGTHVTGISSYKFMDDASVMASNKAEVIWHYINDYVYEQSDVFGGSLGDPSMQDLWLKAEDVAPSAVPVASVTLDQEAASVLVGNTLTLTATALPTYALEKTVTWVSSDESVATVKDGVVTGVKAGTATITAKAGEKSATCTVTVATEAIAVTGISLDKSEATVTENGTVTLMATVSPDNATNKTVTWVSSDESVATVKDGVVTGVKAGTATITATAGEKSATCMVTVNKAVVAVTKISLDKSESSVAVGKTVTLTASILPTNATDKSVIWESSDEGVATVKDGVVTGVKAGAATITAKAGEKSATCTVTVVTEEIAVTGIALDKSEAAITAGETLTLTATVTPDNATDKTVTWVSSDESVATVKDGVVSGVKAGTAIITAKAGEKSAACTVTVKKAVELPYSEQLEAVLAYVESSAPNPKVDSMKGEWAVFALNRGNAAKDAWNDIYLENLKATLDKKNGILSEDSYSEYSRVILALTSMGVDASQITTDKATYDLVKPLLEKQSDGSYQVEYQGNNGTIFALLALDSHDYLPGAEGKSARAAFIESLLNNQLDNGAWAISGRTIADLDTTAAAIYALAPYYCDPDKLSALGGTVTYADVKAMVDDALAYLSGAQNADGGFGSAEADAWTVVALSALGRDANADAAFIKNGNSLLANLLGYFDENSGGFRHLTSGSVDQMASEQAAYGLVAYDRFVNEKNTLYDMSDVKIASLEEKANKAAAEEAEDLIDAIGEVTLESKAKIDAARAAYDALTDEQKALVGNLQTLADAENTYKNLAAKADQEEVDKAAAKGVEDLIEAIGKVTLDSEKAIKAARSAYDALTDAQKALVKNLATLEDAEKQLKDMQEAAEVLAAVTFHLRNGSSEEITDGEEKVYTKGDEGNDLPDASREGYEFQGWFDFPTDGTKYTKVSADLPEDLYAQWKSTSSGGGSSGSSETKIKVSFRLIGAEKADKKVDLGTEEYMPDYVTWIATTTYEMDEGDTVYDLWVKATHDRGIESEGADNNYVKTVYAPASLGGYALSEFTNGPRSGWMYTINGRHPGYGLVEQELKDGDRIIWHYVNDYAYEVADWIDDGQWQSLGDGRYYSRWLKARDEFGGAGGGLGEGAKAKNSGGSSGSGEVTDLTPSYDGDTVWIPTEVEHSEGGMAYAADAELTKDIVTKGLEKAEDKSKLKLWVDIQDSNRLVLQVDPDAMKEISDAGAGLRLQCSKGVIELDAETVAQLAESGRQVRMTVSYDDWYEKTKVSVGAFPPKDTDTPVTMKIELPVTKDGQALSIVNSDGSRTPIKKSAIIGDRAYAEVTGAVTLEITDIQKYWNDVKEKDWFADAVQFAVSHELMNGVDRYEFAPNAPMTRAMLVTVLYRLEDQPEITGSESSFGDVDADGWYAEAVSWASENGLVNGTEKGFEPNANISREQIATILYRYAKYIGLVGQDDAVSGDVSKFEDRESVSPWAQEAMAWAVEVGLFKGDDTNSLNPQGEATRAEVATLLERLIKLIVLS